MLCCYGRWWDIGDRQAVPVQPRQRLSSSLGFAPVGLCFPMAYYGESPLDGLVDEPRYARRAPTVATSE